jgi:copper chaperone CopZ
VRSTDVRLADGKVIVVYEKAKLAPSKLVEAIDALGYKAGKPSQG